MKHEVIQFVDIKDLTTADQAIVHELCTEYYEKIRRQIKDMTSLIVHLKEHEKDGNRRKYSFHIRALSPSHTFTSTKASDWDVARALHQSFQNLMNQIQHTLHSDDQKPKFG